MLRVGPCLFGLLLGMLTVAKVGMMEGRTSSLKLLLAMYFL